jgi:hypothetical protein
MKYLIYFLVISLYSIPVIAGKKHKKKTPVAPTIVSRGASKDIKTQVNSSGSAISKKSRQNRASRLKDSAPVAKTPEMQVEQQVEQIENTPLVEKRESQWLASLDVHGQTGLYAAKTIQKGQFIEWYEGKIYSSVRQMLELIPTRKSMDMQQFRYFYDVYSEESIEESADESKRHYLYSIDAYQPAEGHKEMCLAAYVNHKPSDLANAEFMILRREGAPGGLAPAVVAKRKIKAGEEITLSYGKQFERRLQETAPSYRSYLEKNHPQHVIQLKDQEESEELPLSLFYELLPSLFEEVFAPLPTVEKEYTEEEFSIEPYTIFWDKNDPILIHSLSLELNQQQAQDRINSLDQVIMSYKFVQDLLDSKLNRLDSLKEIHPLKRSRVKKDLELIAFKNLQRLTLCWWRVSLIYLGQVYNRVELNDKVSAQNQGLFSLSQAKSFAQRADQLGLSQLPFSELFRILSAQKTFHSNDIFIIQEGIFIDLKQQVVKNYERLYGEASRYKEIADIILEEDSHILKSDESKRKDRDLAISYYQYAFYLIENEEKDREIEMLKGHIKWTLAECHHDSVLNHPQVALEYAKQSFDHYKAAKAAARRRDKELEKDISVVVELINKLEQARATIDG